MIRPSTTRTMSVPEKEMSRPLAGISPKTLTDRLRHLEAHGVLIRHAYAEVPPRVEYRLTDRGRSLEPVLLALWEWGHDDLVPAPTAATP